MFKNNIGIGY
jgi:hypothetical protein